MYPTFDEERYLADTKDTLYRIIENNTDSVIGTRFDKIRYSKFMRNPERVAKKYQQLEHGDVPKEYRTEIYAGIKDWKEYEKIKWYDYDQVHYPEIFAYKFRILKHRMRDYFTYHTGAVIMQVKEIPNCGVVGLYCVQEDYGSNIRENGIIDEMKDQILQLDGYQVDLGGCSYILRVFKRVPRILPIRMQYPIKFPEDCVFCELKR